MSIWKQVETGLADIQSALAQVPPDVPDVRRLVNDLADVAANRKLPRSRRFKPEELEKAVEHLAFEMLHFRSYSKLYDNNRLRAFSGAAHQAVRYSLLLHLRVLIDFFYSDPTQDDCHVNHFNILPGFEAKFPADLHVHTQETAAMSVNLNKLLVHLTATRWEKHRPMMDYYDEYGVAIDGLITKFEAALPSGIREIFLTHYRKWERQNPGTVA